MYNIEQLYKKWGQLLDHAELAPIKDPVRRATTAVLLENQEKALREGNTDGMLTETIANAVGDGVTYAGNPQLKGYDPVLIAMVRRLAPNLIAYDLCGVQPMKAPIGLIFALKARYTSQVGDEALYREADTAFSGQNGVHTLPLDPMDAALDTGRGAATGDAEQWGSGAPALNIPEMAISIDRVAVTAKTRALKAEFSQELQQDLKAIHGLDAENELADILSTEIDAEINREIVRTIYLVAVQGAQHNVSIPGEFDMDIDSNGRWLVEKFKGLMFQIERDANQIAKETRRGKGNVLVTSSDVASALSMAGLLDVGTNLKKDALDVDDTGNTFAGVLNGQYRVYIDPYFATQNNNFYVVGYKGKTIYDAGLYFCPYVPLQLTKALDPQTFQPKMSFRTRYGLVANPFSNLNGDSDGTLVANANRYYRKVRVLNLL